MALDIGPQTIIAYSNQIKNARTVLWNGPMGVFEMSNFAEGTFEVARALAEVTKLGATTIIGGEIHLLRSNRRVLAKRCRTSQPAAEPAWSIWKERNSPE